MRLFLAFQKAQKEHYETTGVYIIFFPVRRKNSVWAVYRWGSSRYVHGDNNCRVLWLHDNRCLMCTMVRTPNGWRTVRQLYLGTRHYRCPPPFSWKLVARYFLRKSTTSFSSRDSWTEYEGVTRQCRQEWLYRWYKMLLHRAYAQLFHSQRLINEENQIRICEKRKEQVMSLNKVTLTQRNVCL